MKLSMMSYTMARQPEHFNMEGMLDLTEELELDGIDFVTLHGIEARELRKMVDDRGIPVVCYTFSVNMGHDDPEDRRAAVDEARRGIETAVILGAPVVMIPSPGREGMDRNSTRRNWIEGLKETAPAAADAGVILTVENFPGVDSPFVIADDLLQAVDEIPGFRITYDNGNAASGEDPAESFSRCAEYVVHSHFKDWTVRDERDEEHPRMMLDGRYYRSALIGEGVVDHRACLAAMKAAGYDGCINIEYENNDYTPDEAVRRAADYLRGIAAEIGY